MAFPVTRDATWVNPGTVTLDAGELRRADSAMFAGIGSALGVGGGTVRHGDTSLAVTVDGSDNVTVQPGSVVIPGNAVSGTGCYRSGLETATTNALTARHATLARIDLVVFRMLDTDVVGSHTDYRAKIDVIAGTPSATPVAPSLPSMAVELARISVPATGGGSATVDSTFRTYATAIGGELVVPTAARLPASAALYQRYRALDTGDQGYWNGTTWITAGFVQAVIKPTDETVTSSTTLQSDDALGFSVTAGGSYLFDLQLHFVCSTSSADAKLAFTFPTGTLSWAPIAMDYAATSGNQNSGVYVGSVGAASDTPLPVGIAAAVSSTAPVRVVGSFVATASGTVQLRWAQNTSNAAGLTLKAGSHLRAERVA